MGAGAGVSDWTVRRTSARELIISFTGSPPGDGPCGARLRAVADEDAASVRLSVVNDNPDEGPRDGEPVACTAIGYLWALPVTLERDLAGRDVVDGDGTAVTLVDALAPSRLPSGYALKTESGNQSSYSLTYLSPDGGWLLVATWNDESVARVEEAFSLVEDRKREGRVYRLLENGMQRLVAFDVEDRRVWVSWMQQRDDSTARLTWDALLDVAASVQ
jgi:hypothetical protein